VGITLHSMTDEEITAADLQRAADLHLFNQVALVVVEAWTNPGSHPDVHARYQHRLEASWPTLAMSLRRLAEAAEHV